jgi:hypothetical protein
LKDAGNISHEVAKKLAEDQYEKFRIDQDKNFESDFDKEVKKLNPPISLDEFSPIGLKKSVNDQDNSHVNPYDKKLPN